MGNIKAFIDAFVETFLEVFLGFIFAIAVFALISGYFWLMLSVAKSFPWFTTVIICSFVTSALVALLGALIEIFGY
ncbi:MAG: hypothetical protein H9W80_00750 [Enterococcus sp.]|nr:hypothetical protein [Enterococcus sp.]